MKKCSDVEMLQELPRPDDFLDLSNRGIYGFDWCDVHRSKKEKTNRYELISRPVRPILFDEIRYFFGENLPAITFENILFEEVVHIGMNSSLVWVTQ